MTWMRYESELCHEREDDFDTKNKWRAKSAVVNKCECNASNSGEVKLIKKQKPSQIARIKREMIENVRETVG